MGDCLRAGKLSHYITSHPRQLSLSSLRGRYMSASYRLGRQRQGHAGKSVRSLVNTCHTWALLRWWFTKRRYIKRLRTFTFTLLLIMQYRSTFSPRVLGDASTHFQLTPPPATCWTHSTSRTRRLQLLKLHSILTLNDLDVGRYNFRNGTERRNALWLASWWNRSSVIGRYK